jgi:hypothetical protein
VPPRLNPCVHLGQNVFEWNRLHSSRVNLFEAALDLAVLGRLNLRFRLAVVLDKKRLDQPVSLIGRQLANLFKNFLCGAVHGGIVTRNRFPNPRIEARAARRSKDNLALSAILQK